MILRITDEKYAEVFVDIYNSANTLFEPSARGIATADLFARQIKEDENFAKTSDCGKILAFLSYRRHTGCFEISSLYVRREYQKKGTGRMLLQYFEEQVPDNGIIFVKVLKNAPWAQDFYRRNGYVLADAEMRELAASFAIAEKPWSMVLYKKCGTAA